nr:oligosaccharide flippase family protein [uncultured Carboxylicivirga sp.]
MLRKFKFKKNSLLSISIKNSSQVIVRSIIGILNIKLVAVIAGPGGMAIISQLQSFLQLCVNTSGAGINNGVIKYISDNRNNPNRINIITSTSSLIVILLSITIGIINILLSKEISIILFDTPNYHEIIQFSWIYIMTTTLFNLILALINGLQKLNIYILLNLIYFISGFLIMATTLYCYNLHTALWALLFQSTLASFIAILILIKTLPLKKPLFSRLIIRRLSNFSIMSLTAAIITPTTTILIRNIIINTLSIKDAGIWDGVNKISSSFIGFATLPFAYYFLPTFTRLNKSSEIKKEIKNSYLVIIPILLFSSAFIFIFRHQIIHILLSNNFVDVALIIKWQLLGDIFHVLSWVLGLLLIVKERTKTYVLTELTSAVILTLLSILLINKLGISGSTLAYFLEKLFTFIILYVIYLIHYKK